MELGTYSQQVAKPGNSQKIVSLSRTFEAPGRRKNDLIPGSIIGCLKIQICSTVICKTQEKTPPLVIAEATALVALFVGSHRILGILAVGN